MAELAARLEASGDGGLWWPLLALLILWVLLTGGMVAGAWLADRGDRHR